MRRRRILLAGYVARMEDTRLSKCFMLRELMGGAACVGGRKKSGWGVSWMTSELSVLTPTSGRLQPAMRGGAFHGKMDRCRESQGWTTVRSSMPEHDGNDQGEESPKQACSSWFACHSRLATSGANLYPPGVFCFVCRYHILPFSGVTCFFFH